MIDVARQISAALAVDHSVLIELKQIFSAASVGFIRQDDLSLVLDDVLVWFDHFHCE